MQVRFLLGPAGSGKTFACLAEIRRELIARPNGPPLILLAPKQATFQLERQLLETGELNGYTRLQILSFDRFADFVLTELGFSAGELLSEEGRLMVLRALLAKHRDDLSLYRSAARMPGFAGQLSELLRESRRHHLDATRMESLAGDEKLSERLRAKLADVSRIASAYRVWLEENELNDADEILDLAAKRLGELKVPSRLDPENPTPIYLSGLWLDGFAEMTPQETEFLAAVMPFCERATLAFCLPGEMGERNSRFSMWNVIGATFGQCRERLEQLPSCDVSVETLDRDPDRSRFGLAHGLGRLERDWDSRVRSEDDSTEGIELVQCADRETEAVFAARAVRRHVREGGRYRGVTILVRDLEAYGHVIRRVFTRYGIPFFLDQRESAAHHPLAELTRFSLRCLAYKWQREDWFGLLKTGLCGVGDSRIDWLENLALANGWEGIVWRTGDAGDVSAKVSEALREVQEAVVQPMLLLEGTLGIEPGTHPRISGAILAETVRGLWKALGVSRRLEKWSEADWPGAEARVCFNEPAVVHRTVWEQMGRWLDSLVKAFPEGSGAMTLREWLPVLEAGLGNLTVGVIPPSIDQVLIGAIDRARNPEVDITIVLGMNEGVFPASPGQPLLLTELERDELAGHQSSLGSPRLHQLAHERYLGYIACTRPRKQLCLTWAKVDDRGRIMPWSSIVDHVCSVLNINNHDRFSLPVNGDEVEHGSEILAEAIQGEGESADAIRLLPSIEPIVNSWRRWQEVAKPTPLGAPLAAQMFPIPWKTSVSALEKFAECPFKFYANYGLRADERAEFEPDIREQGTFQHDVMEEFHKRAMAAGGWDALDVNSARDMVTEIANDLLPTSAEGKLNRNAATLFQAKTMVENLRKLVGALVGWMETNAFRPRHAELSFGLDEQALPGLPIEIDAQRSLLLRGKIDRIDLMPLADDPGKALVVIVDYKSSVKKLEATPLWNGLQLQLLSYLHVVRELPGLAEFVEAKELIPAGVFYVNLRPAGSDPVARGEIADDDETQSRLFQHQGRFNKELLDFFDSVGGRSGSGQVKRSGNNPVSGEALEALRERVVGHVRSFGGRVLDGDVAPDPYRDGNRTACDYCEYAGICRFDPWEQDFRSLEEPPKPERKRK